MPACLHAAPALALACLAALAGLACASQTLGARPGAPLAASRRLLGRRDGRIARHEAAERRESLLDSGGQPGDYTGWAIECESGRPRCPSLFLASYGYQCARLDGAGCCLTGNGKFCVALEAAEGQRTPDTWRGEDAGGEEQAWPQDSQDWSAAEEGGSWKQAAATFFTSYPSCCGQDDWEGGDDSECTDYNGCQWAGHFKGADEQKSRSWVRSTNIVSVFEAGRSDEWEERWKGRSIRIKDPQTGNVMEAQVLDTCSDSDCGGCCTRNARHHGGVLIDLEYHTARRFWGEGVHRMGEVQWQLAA